MVIYILYIFIQYITVHMWSKITVDLNLIFCLQKTFEEKLGFKNPENYKNKFLGIAEKNRKKA